MADKPRSPRPHAQPAAHKVGGVDRRTMQILEEKGLLNQAGRKALTGGPVDTSERPAKAAAGRSVRPDTDRGAEGPTKRGRRGDVRVEESIPEERLQKVMAQAGVASRRHSEELIQAGRVSVNGQPVTELGTKVIPGRDIVEVDGRRLGKPETLIHILLNKPKGYVTTLFDPQGRPKVTDLLEGEVGERVYPVGRLDYDTEGLLLLTNDGELANALMHPAKEVKKTYIAKVRGVPGPGKIRELESGIELDDGMTAPAEVKMLDVKPPNAATLSVRIHEGKNRQVRRMFEAVGHEVIHLRRTTMGPLALRDLELGQWRYLSTHEINDLRKAAGIRPLKADAEEGAVGARAGGRKPAARGTARGLAPRAGRGAARGGGAPAGAGRFGEQGPEEAQAEAPAFSPRPAGFRPGLRPAAGGPRPDGPRPGGAGPRSGGPRPVGSRPGGPRPDGPRPGGAGPRSGGPRPDGPRPGGAGPRSGGPRPDGPRPDGPRPGGAGPRSGGARPGGSRPGGAGPRSGGARPGGSRPGGSRPGTGGPRGGARAGGVRKNRSPK